GEWIALADPLRAVVLEEERTDDLLRLDFQPDFFILAVDVEKPGLLLGVLDDFGERFLLGRDRGCRGSRGGGGDRRGAACFRAAGLGRRMTGARGDRRSVFG